MLKVLSDTQSLNANLPISATVSGIVTDLRLIQPLKVSTSIFLTLDGITTVSSFRQSLNAPAAKAGRFKAIILQFETVCVVYYTKALKREKFFYSFVPIRTAPIISGFPTSDFYHVIFFKFPLSEKNFMIFLPVKKQFVRRKVIYSSSS